MILPPPFRPKMSYPSNRFEQLETLRKAAWESIANRRQFEWRLCIAFWTLLLVIVAAFGTGQVPTFDHSHRCAAVTFHVIAAIVVLALGIVHTIWLFGLKSAYRLDKLEESDFREVMRRIAEYTERPKLTELREEAIKSGWKQVFVQTAMTWILVLLAVIIIIFHCVGYKAPKRSDKSGPNAAHRVRVGGP
jgi:uncharacterized membrane protein